MRSVSGRLALFVAGLLLVVGCRPAPRERPVYTQEEPGPWSEVMPEPPKLVNVGDNYVRLTIDYRARMADFVNRIWVMDDQGSTVLNLARDYDQPLDVTFAVPPGTETLTVIVSSTTRGLWQSQPIAVSAIPEGDDG